MVSPISTQANCPMEVSESIDPKYRDLFERIERLQKRYIANKHDYDIFGSAIVPFKRVPPPFLHKYLDINTVLPIMLSGKMRYSQAEVLDDLFEERLPYDEMERAVQGFEGGPSLMIDAYDSEDTLQVFDRIKNQRHRLRVEGLALNNDFLHITSNGINEGFETFAQNKGVKRYFETFMRPLSLCLTECYNNNLMWALYGSGHTGAILSFNARHKYFYGNRHKPSAPGFFGPISYRNITSEIHSYLFAFERCFVKGLERSYQKEWRRTQLDSDIGVRGKDAIHLVDYPRDCIKRLTFGARSSKETMDDIITKVSSMEEFRMVEFYQSLPTLGGLRLKRL